jgi:hypothetical protein
MAWRMRNLPQAEAVYASVARLESTEKERGEVMDKKDFDSWKSVIEEVKRYLDKNVNHFTVSSGSWTITYDNMKESEVLNAD